MKLNISNRRRLLLVVGILPVLLVAALYIGFPLVMAFAAIAPQYESDVGQRVALPTSR